MARKRGKDKESFIETLFEAPWQVSAAIGIAVFVGMKWGLPAMAGNNPILIPMMAAFSGLAWLFGGLFVLVGAIVFIKTAVSRSKRAPRPSLRVVNATKNHAPEWQPPAWAPQVKPTQSAQLSMPTPEATQCGRLCEPLFVSMTTSPPNTQPAAQPTEWSLDLIRQIEWKRYEDVCQMFYEIKGLRSETTPLGPDGGIDIRLFQGDSTIATSIVQCKAWGERFVGVKPVRELLGVMTHEKVEKAFFMTSGRFTDDARAFADGNRIILIDGEMLLIMIKRLAAPDQQTLLDFATAGDFATPTCPSCGIPMRSVPGKAGRPDFWGCRNYPKCRQMLGMRRKLQS